ncbi:glycosyltransferase family 4 protein [Sulfurovum sp.]|uniref:glycosyltransferase family 4 protein n=1 Tax=Sulfurovum sp. TaxID=1969726 RepID=UPI0035696C54
MKIVFVSGSLRGGGAERVLSLLANEFSMRHHNVTVITKAPECDYILNEKVKWKPIFRKDEIKTSAIDKISRRFKYLPRLFASIKSEKPDLIISFLVGMNGKIILISRLLNIPVIVSEHTNHRADMNLLSWIERRWVYKLADAVTVLTKYDYNNYYAHFLKNVYVMPNPVSFTPVDALSQREKIILVSGNLNRWSIKGFDNLLKLFSNVVTAYPDWKLKIAGSGEEGKKYLMQLANELNIQDNVEFLGFCPNIDEVMQQSSIFVLSSRYEGFGMVLVEAMSQGCPCISFDCTAGPNEIIRNGVDGILVEDQNMQQMECEIIRLIEDDKLCKELALNAIKNIQRFSVQKIADKWIELINKVVENHK